MTDRSLLPRRVTALFLLLSALNLAAMVPGGLVETRSFPAYPPTVLAAFNLFLSGLGLGSLALAAIVWRRGAGTIWPLAAGIAYVAVYTLDLAALFPIGAQPMPRLLMTLEAAGVFLAVPVIAAAPVLTRADPLAPSVLRVSPAIWIGGVLVLGTITALATRAALG